VDVPEQLPKGARILVTGRLEQRSWESQDGERRSKIEVVADEIGPSLRWATCTVVKNERRQAVGAGASVATRTATTRSVPDDNEPF